MYRVYSKVNITIAFEPQKLLPAPLGYGVVEYAAISLYATIPLPLTTPFTMPYSSCVAMLMMASDWSAVAGVTSQGPDATNGRLTECIPGAEWTFPTFST
mmetsp:Transcript_17128/g.29185  ORF Transcript_17128/g.29185 Transcript_17128/m.29185 type:complete len:100 (+) Transcript_17128:643-942(+)